VREPLEPREIIADILMLRRNPSWCPGKATYETADWIIEELGNCGYEIVRSETTVAKELVSFWVPGTAEERIVTPVADAPGGLDWDE
jgi:hypothetical protein